jgi:hypothetical protein
LWLKWWSPYFASAEVLRLNPSTTKKKKNEKIERWKENE